MKEEQMDVSSAASKEPAFMVWVGKNRWIAAVIAGLLAFIGLAMPLVLTHGAALNPEEWGIEEAFKRAPLGAEILFGGKGAIVWPTLLLYIGIVIAIALILIGHFIKTEKQFLMVSLLLFVVIGVFFLVSASFYGFCNAQANVAEFAKRAPGFEEGYNDNYYWFIKEYITVADSRLGVGAIWSAAFSFIAALSCFVASISEEKYSVHDITEIGVLTASAIVLDVIFHFIPNIPGQACSISIALLPLYLIALRHGAAKGFLASAIVYGLITCATDGYGFFLYPLDYFVGFAGVAVLGLFRPLILGKDQEGYNAKGIIFIVVGTILSAVIRLIGSGASSIVNYGYTVEAALIANLSIFISAGICAAIMVAIYGPLLKINRLFPVKR
ncbi:MAG: energy-coupled thiamine transporter ThiT [Bacilli bacterium]|nr:energy-coupled thiamine transporter ThiT [Bacilli bacterium]